MLFYIVGGPTNKKNIPIKNSQNVRITGFVDDLDDYYNRCKIFIAPIRRGSGIKFKIINALAGAKPVITTTLGNKGISGIPDKDLIIADSAEEFSEKTKMLLGDPEKRKYIGENGFALFNKKFNNNKNKLISIYNNL